MMVRNNGDTTKMTCGGCVRFEKRNRNSEDGRCFWRQERKAVVYSSDAACENYSDLKEKQERESQKRMREEQERQELWKRNENNPPMLPMLEFDCDGMPGDEAFACPICPNCREVLYEYEDPDESDGSVRCYFCGQRIIQEDQIDETKVIKTTDCYHCGGIRTFEYTATRYSNCKEGHCSRCGMQTIE